MRVRLGYVSISKTLENSISYHNITYTEFNKNKDYEKLDRIILSNFETLENIIEYNKKNNIHFYIQVHHKAPDNCNKVVE